MIISVEMDVFSGRPNPTWELSSSESGELLKQLSPLPELDKNKGTFNDGLGYRGFIVSATDKANTPPLIYRVCNGFILMDGHVFADKNLVENQLIKQARVKGLGDLLDALHLKD